MSGGPAIDPGRLARWRDLCVLAIDHPIRRLDALAQLTDELRGALEAMAPSETVTVACDDYHAHQHHHRREGAGFVCPVCRPASRQPAEPGR